MPQNPPGRPSALQAGFAEVDITPPAHCMLAGYFHPRKIEGVLDPLFARAAVLESGGQRIALVSCDLLSLRRETVATARREIERTTGIPGQNVALFATHTHTGPFPSRIFGVDPDEGYLATVASRIAEAVGSAARALAPAELGVGTAFEARISFPRRWVMKDGKVRTHPPRGSTDLSHPEGPMDPEVGVLCFRRPGGEVAGLFVDFACHTNVVGGSQVSADYPGGLSRAAKARYGASCVTVFGNGACGDLCQIDVTDPSKKDYGWDWADHMGQVLAEDVERAIASMAFGPRTAAILAASGSQQDAGGTRTAAVSAASGGQRDAGGTAVRLGAARRALSVPIRDPEATPYHGTMFGGEPGPELDARYKEEQTELTAKMRGKPNVDFEVQALRIGPAALVMIPAELFVEFGLEIKLRSPIQPTFVIELANGVVGYVPTPKAFARGGYETRTASSSKLVPEAGDQIVAAALAALTELQA